MLHHHAITVLAALHALIHDDVRDERGDVPGWVMITLMSAVLVAGLLALALPALEGLFNQAISQVSQGG
ncbi:hypothetical protein [Micrococcus luteus]|uniref:hypothetical protein n=1 Tax=Micrococcus luteus TaxID=1270 RepID=UPI0036BF99EA